MELICDLEIHSRYARAVSKNMSVEQLVTWSQKKGTTLAGTGDFTHPLWLQELQRDLIEEGSGLLRPKSLPREHQLRFMLTAEVSCIFSQGGKGRRVHCLIMAPSFQVAQAISDKLAHHGKLLSDGRPILGLSLKKLLEYVLAVNEAYGLTDDIAAATYAQHPGAFLIPAHVWTPWFGLFGSKSGFDSLDEAFEELSPHVRAVETGLSSDPAMNWRIAANDRLALVSFSDAHSAPNLMREATVVQVSRQSYASVAQALQNPRRIVGQEQGIKTTVEFFPEEGKYHYDGIADQKLSLSPSQRKQLAEKDPVLAKKITIGVMSRVDELANRPEGFTDQTRPPYVRVIPLQEIIADVLQVGKQSKKVQALYDQAVMQTTEYRILLHLTEPELATIFASASAFAPDLVRAVLQVRQGRVEIEPGYDGVYGVIRLPK